MARFGSGVTSMVSRWSKRLVPAIVLVLVGSGLIGAVVTQQAAPTSGSPHYLMNAVTGGAHSSHGSEPVGGARAATDAFASPSIGPPGANTWGLAVTVPVGSRPMFVAYDSSKGELFVTNFNSNNVSVISDSTYAVVATVPVGAGPAGLAYDPVLGQLYVANSLANTVTVISDATNSIVGVVPMPGLQPFGVAIDPLLGEVFVTETASNRMAVMTVPGNFVAANIAVGNTPMGVTFDPRMSEMFVANSNSGTISVVSEAMNMVVATVAMPMAQPTGVIYDPATFQTFVSGALGSTVAVVQDGGNVIVATVAVPPAGMPTSTALAYDPGAREVVVTYGTGPMCIISDVTDRALQNLSVSSGPSGVAYDPARGELFVATPAINIVSIFDPTYPLVFTETGLPPGTNWSVTLDNGTNALTSSSAQFDVFNGTHTFAVLSLIAASTAWYSTSPTAGIATMSGAEVDVTVPYSALPTEPLKVRESGLPGGGGWSMSIGIPGFGMTKSSTTNLIVFTAPVATVPYTLAPPAGFGVYKVVGPSNPTPSAINVTGLTTVSVQFGPYETLSFVALGLPTGSVWGVSIWSPVPHGGGAPQSGTTTGPTINFTVVKGAWKFQLTSKPTTYRATPGHGSVGVPAHSVTKTIKFKLISEKVIFKRSGLTAGTYWQVNITSAGNGSYSASMSGTGATLVFFLPNGSYNYAIWNYPAHHPHPGSGTLSIVAPGAALVVTVAYTSIPVHTTLPSPTAVALPVRPS